MKKTLLNIFEIIVSIFVANFLFVISLMGYDNYINRNYEYKIVNDKETYYTNSLTDDSDSGCLYFVTSKKEVSICGDIKGLVTIEKRRGNK